MRAGTLHAFEHWLLNYKRTWHGTLFSGFLLPVLFIVGLGMAVGGYVNGSSAIGGVDYVAFIAPGLLASTAFQISSGELTWPVFAATRWGSQYKAMQASPLSPGEILNGHLLYGLLRGVSSALFFFIVMAVFGLLQSAWAPLALLAAAATAASVIGATYAVSMSAKHESALSMVHRFAILPLTLFSAVFFPLAQLPSYIQPLAWISPVWHGVELSRAATLGVAPPWPIAAHIGVLAVWAVGGWYAARRSLLKKLKV
ncbi:transport permease protein [Actinorhabdospora filicis]|uniref:Transport permease protein n=1 Tax=Actinorhabdospora filicis TaxID=1785913 RepID=A0A9W6SP32_9ACTN|nr:ABC transporter permease [Actinorhabdospora filicis]GLZ79482.1 transport permease protein [Actinorhabdospora filicis]